MNHFPQEGLANRYEHKRSLIRLVSMRLAALVLVILILDPADLMLVLVYDPL